MCRYFFLPSLLIAVPFAQAQTLIIPQMADGANWQTTLVLTNTTASATSASVNFFQDIGGGATQSWTPPFVEVNSTQNLALPAGGTLFLHTPGTASALTVGWGQLQPNPAVVAYAIYTLRVPGRQDQDVTSAAAPGATRYLVPFDNTKGFVTSIAIANPTNAAESISVGIETSSGASSLPSPISLPGLGHTTFVLPTKFAATMGQTGLIEFSSASGTFSVLALRTNPTGAFATAPVYPETGPPIITGSTTQPINSITVNSAALGITNLLLVFPTANGGFSSGSVQGLLKANGSPNGSYSATWNNVTVNGQTLTFTGLQTSASTMQNTGGTTANISSATLTLTLTPQGPTGGTVSGTMTLTSTLATVSGPFTGTYSAQPGSSGSSPSVTFYVAPNGNDSWSGMLPAPNATNTDGPFATLDHARAIVRPISKAGTSQVNIQVRAGTYFLPATVTFGAADSGSATTKVVYQNYPSESPIISGGVRIQNWTNVSGNTWQATLPASTEYFENLFYNDVRRLRPRIGGYLGTYLRVAATVYLHTPGPPAAAPDPNCSVYVTGSGWECFDRFQYNSADPVVNTWKNLAPPVGNPCAQPAGNPSLVGDIELVDFEKYSVAKLRISCVDAANHIVYLTGPTLMNPNSYTAVGFIATHRYLVENVQDQFAQPGQWFLDRSTIPWTLTYLANTGENPKIDTVIIPQVQQLLAASGLQYATFQGLTFEHDNYTMPSQGVSDPQDQATAALSFQNSQHITFDSGITAHTAGTGLEFISCINAQSPSWCISRTLNAVTSNNAVQNSAFYDLGLTSVRIGMPGLAADTLANIPQLNIVQNNVVEGYGRVFPAAFGIIQGDGHDNLFTHNDVYDGYKGAIHICDCSGSGFPSLIDNVTVSFNHVHDLFQGIMNDGGSIYIQASNVGSPQVTGTGNKLLNNKIHDVSDASALDLDGYGGDGLYIDDFAGLIDVENNLVYRVSGAALSFSGPRAGPNNASTIKNNVFAFGRLAMISTSDPYTFNILPPAPLFAIATNNLFYFDRNSTLSPPFYTQGGCTYAGEAFTAFEQWNSNLYWRTDGRFASDAQAFHVQPNPAPSVPCYFGNPSKLTFYTFDGWQQSGEDAQSVVQDPGFENPAYPADDYSLPKGSPGVGFVVFDPNQAGRSNPVINPPSVPATFPTKTFNPALDF